MKVDTAVKSIGATVTLLAVTVAGSRGGIKRIVDRQRLLFAFRRLRPVSAVLIWFKLSKSGLPVGDT